MATKKAMYALRAVTALGDNHGNGRLNAPTIAEAERIPERFCESTLTHLTLAKVLKSVRGRGGGFVLRRPPEQITVADVLEAVDGRIGPASFAAPDGENGDDDEDEEFDADVRAVFQRAHEAMVKELRSETIASLVVKRRKRREQKS